MTKMTSLTKIKLFVAISAILTLIIGAVSHFIYEWSGENAIAGLLFATNESVWEHIKLALFPMLLIFTAGIFFLRKRVNNYFTAAFCAMSVMILFIIFAFYGYTFFFRRSILLFDISIFAIAIALGYFSAYVIFFKRHSKVLNIISAIGIVVLYAMFFTLTYHAPALFLFEEVFLA